MFHDPGPSENCLTLNVWTPAGAKRGSLPVMVWIYGGGFVAGGTSEDRQDGEFLPKRGVVVVSMNYRLGIFGFFAHPELTAESPHHASGNYGLMDIAAALQWVKANIAGFGGDPSNVTIFGGIGWILRRQRRDGFANVERFDFESDRGKRRSIL